MTTSSQLPLSITPRLPFKSSNYVVHSGVSKIVEGATKLVSQNNFQLIFIEGGKTSGKTHLSVYLADKLANKDRYPRIIDGLEFKHSLDFINSNFDSAIFNKEKNNTSSESFLIIDSAEEYFETVSPVDEGKFVTFIEKLRKLNLPVIFISAKSIESLKCDVHIMSRLKSSISFLIEDPNEEEMRNIVNSMILQRGLKLKDKKLDFLMKRLPRSIHDVTNYLERLDTLMSIKSAKADFGTLGDAI